MPSNKETLFQEHICKFLQNVHGYFNLDDQAEKPDHNYHIIREDLIEFIKATQEEKYKAIQENYGSDTDLIIEKSLVEEFRTKPLWLTIRNGLMVKGTKLQLYIPKPRSTKSSTQLENFHKNKFVVKTEYFYSQKSKERIDMVVWLNGLPIIVSEIKHEDEGQDVNDAIYDSFLKRDLTNNLYKLPFMYLALSDTEAKVATNPSSEKNFLWFNAALINEAETEGEYPVEHVYRHALAPNNICEYLEHYLVFVPAKEKETNGVWEKKPSFSIFPRYHQFRSSKELAKDVYRFREENQSLGNKYLVNHSAGAGKTLTIAWMADRLDSLYTSDNKKVFDNIIILTDRKALDKNVKDDLELFTHLGRKLNFTNKSKDLADFLDKDKDIIVTTIHKFSHIQEKLQNDSVLKNRNVAFLIDEAHRSQDGKLALTMRKFFNDDEAEKDDSNEDENIEDLKKLNIGNQVFVAFTATTTPKTVSFFGEPFDIYSEDEAIAEGYILDVAQNIVSYQTLYNLQLTEALPEKDFPDGVVKKLLRNIAYEDDEIIQYKSGVIMKYFEEKVLPSIEGQGKAMVVTSSRIAGLKYFETIKAILEEKNSPWKVLYAFSDFTHPDTNESIEEDKINNLEGKLIDDTFSEKEYRILVVANKFQTGFNEPLLSTMFLDKSINGVNAIQTVSRLNRCHPDKAQSDILVVDFTNNSAKIFEAFNKHRKGSPFKEKEPDKAILDELYSAVIEFGVFDKDEITKCVETFLKSEEDAINRDSSGDTAFTNLVQAYRKKFKEKLKTVEAQKQYVALLRRYEKVYYFIAQFFELEDHLNEFVNFSKVMGQLLIKKGKTSELKQFIKKVELSKGAVKYKGTKTNMTVAKEPKQSGYKTGGLGREISRTTIEAALEDIKEQFNITEEDAIVIREVCEEVSDKTSMKEKVIANKENKDYLQNNAKPKVESEVKEEYIKRDLWDKLDDPMYVEKGGIISLIGRAVIQNVIRKAI